MIEKHGDFQLVYSGERIGADPEKRQAFADHIFFDNCAAFWARWDQVSIDPAYDMWPLAHFADRVRAIFARTPYDPVIIRPGARYLVPTSPSQTAFDPPLGSA